MARILAALAAVASLLVMVGCGGKAATPKAAFEAFVAAAKSGDQEKMAACMDKPTGDAMKELMALAEEMGQGKAADPTEEFKKTEFTCGEEKIDGGKATLQVTGNGKTQTVQFVQEDGAWKISIPELTKAVTMIKGFKAMGFGK
jgi:phage host-nuclease inhibitor protein Gam